MNTPVELTTIRQNIDRIDDQIVPLLVQRIGLALQASQFKRTEEEVRGCDRVQLVLDKAATRAKNAGGHADTVVAVYRHLVHELTELQLRMKGMQA
jgi:isochorismate pyruvate lyase